MHETGAMFLQWLSICSHEEKETFSGEVSKETSTNVNTLEDINDLPLFLSMPREGCIFQYLEKNYRYVKQHTFWCYIPPSNSEYREN